MYIHIHTHIHTYIHIYTHIYTYIHIHTHTDTHIHIHAHLDHAVLAVVVEIGGGGKEPIVIIVPQGRVMVDGDGHDGKVFEKVIHVDII